MRENAYSTGFGPSTPGLLTLVSGQTNGATNISPVAATFAVADGGAGSFTVISDPDPLGDTCSGSAVVIMKGQTVGDWLSTGGVSWGSFMGGFDLTIRNANGTTGCNRSSAGLAGTTNDYIPHHAFFQYQASTANPTHVRPASIAEIGHDGLANHNYDINDFFAAVPACNFPPANLLTAPAYQDGHAASSDPLHDQL